MRRPSSLNVPCGLSSALAERFPETSGAAERGHGRHSEIHDDVRGIADAKSPEAKAAVRWLREGFAGAQFYPEEPLELRDPETDELITAGTADLVIVGEEQIVVIDWKTGRPEYVPPAEENLQLAAYLAAAMVRWDRIIGHAGLVFLDGDRADAPSPMVTSDVWGLIERVKAEAQRPPVANPGPHCGTCWQRMHCDSYRARVSTALTLLPTSTDLTLTDETAAELVQRAKAVREACDLAEDLAKAHVRNGGRVEAGGKVWVPQSMPGRKSADVKALEAAGLTEYVKQGAPFETWRWLKAGAR